MDHHVKFLGKYSWIFDFKVTRILVDNVLENIPAEWRTFLDSLSIEEFNQVFMTGQEEEVGVGEEEGEEEGVDEGEDEGEDEEVGSVEVRKEIMKIPSDVEAFILERRKLLKHSEVKQRRVEQKSGLSWCQKRGIKKKKEHEIINLASLIADQCRWDVVQALQVHCTGRCCAVFSE